MSTVAWTHDLPPVYADFETQSAADLKAIGGRLYAEDASTRVLSLVALIDGVVHVWVPSTLFKTPPLPSDVNIGWPPGHTVRSMEVHITPELPEVIRHAAESGRLFIGHNVLHFDRFIWRRLIGGAEPTWADTLLLARTGGLPGDLDSLSESAVGQGKDEGKRFIRELSTRTEKTEYLDGYTTKDEDGRQRHYPSKKGTLESVLRYNIADVLLLEKLWEEFATLPVEADVIQVHDDINERGIQVDTGLIDKISRVSDLSASNAGSEIARITDGKLVFANLKSTQQVHRWLNDHGIYIRRYDPATSGYKATLRKDSIEQALANPWMMLDEDNVSVEAVKNIPPVVFDVLRLRATALRITSAKTGRATARVSRDGRIRDLFQYWGAHTGRWTSQGVQIHNLPRPKKGVDTVALIDLISSGQWDGNVEKAYELIRAKLAESGNPRLTVDDALSALIRPIFIPKPGCLFVIADFSAVECRGIAWLAGEAGLLDSLAGGHDVYCEFASRLFKRTITPRDELERQIGKICILGLGYGMGASKFRLFCSLSGVDLEAAGVTAEYCVELYRGTYRKICGENYSGQIEGMTYRRGGLWDKLNAAMFDVVAGRKNGVEIGRCVYEYTRDRTMVCTLPSGRQIRYRNARIEDRVPKYAKERGIDRAKATLIYDGPRGESYLYGAKAAENNTQAICRDLEAHAIVRADREGLPVVFHAHDEIGAEVPEADAEAALTRLTEIMADPPPWAEGFPIAVEGFVSPRYYKKAPKGFPEKTARSGGNSGG